MRVLGVWGLGEGGGRGLICTLPSCLVAKSLQTPSLKAPNNPHLRDLVLRVVRFWG